MSSRWPVYQRKATAMQMHYRVRSVLLSRGSSALTLSPGQWGRESETEFEEVEGQQIGAWESCDPTAERAEFMEDGGKMTEVRWNGETDVKPGDLVTLTLTPSR